MIKFVIHHKSQTAKPCICNKTFRKDGETAMKCMFRR